MTGSSFRQTKRRRTTSKALAGSSVVPVTAARAEANLAQKVLRLERAVKQIKPEVKYFDLSTSSNNVSAANGVVIHLSQIAAGTGVSQRVGDAIRSLWYDINLSVTLSSAVNATNENPSFRFYIAQDTQQVGDTAPVGADLVDQPSNPKVQLLNILVTMQKRFKVLYDSKPQVLYPGTGIVYQNNSVVFPAKVQFNFHRKLNSSIRFNGTAATDIQKGGLYLFFYTDVVVAAADALDFTGTSRLAYTDV